VGRGVHRLVVREALETAKLMSFNADR
jgi:hypothetical protein